MKKTEKKIPKKVYTTEKHLFLKEAKQTQGAAQAKNLEEYWISSVGQTLYNKFIDGYSKKMWQVEDNRQIDDFAWSPKGVALKEGSKEAWDTAISAYPYAVDGYDQYFELSTAEAKVMLNTQIEKFDLPNKTVVLKGEKKNYDIIVNTAPPDIVMNYAHGELPFIGREFHKFVLPVQFAFPENVYFLYYTGTEKFTRLVEYKKFTKTKFHAEAKANSPIFHGDEIKTLKKGFCRIMYLDNPSSISIYPETKISINGEIHGDVIDKGINIDEGIIK